jgi:hypothetical protein
VLSICLMQRDSMVCINVGLELVAVIPSENDGFG